MSKLQYGFLVGLVIVLGLIAFRSPVLNLGAQSNFSGPLNSLAGFQESGTNIVDTNGAWVNTVSSTGAVSLGGAVTFTSAGSATFNAEVTLGNCGTALFRPGAIASEEEQRTGVTVTGIAAGDVALVSWDPATATSSLQTLSLNLLAYASSTNLAEAVFFNSSSSASAAVANSGTIKVCYLD